MSSRIRGLLAVARTPFLPLAALLAVSGAVTQSTAPDVPRLVVAALGLVGAHVLVNVLNELADDATGLDRATRRTSFSGGSGALQQGWVTRRAAGYLALGSALVATSCAAIALWYFGEWRLLPVLLAGGTCITLYSPWLLRLGLGEVATGLGLGGLPVIGAAMLQGGALQPGVWLVALAATAMTFNLLLFNAIPDAEPDARCGRRTLVHILGVTRTAWLGLLAMALAPAALVYGVLAGNLSAATCLAVVPAAVLAVRLWAWRRDDWAMPVPGTVLATNVLHNLGTHVIVIVAALWGR